VGNDQGVVQVIFNKHLDRITEVPVVREFLQRHRMKGCGCRVGENHSFILFRLPYVVEFHDALIENYLEITLSDLNAGLLIDGSVAFARSLELGLQDISQVRKRVFTNSPYLDIFLSEGVRKMDDLDSNLEAIDRLLPLIEAKGGLSSMRDGTFDPRFDFKDSVQPMYYGLKEKYLQCIGLPSIAQLPNP
jgi:hypothetical protein